MTREVSESLFSHISKQTEEGTLPFLTPYLTPDTHVHAHVQWTVSCHISSASNSTNLPFHLRPWMFDRFCTEDYRWNVAVYPSWFSGPPPPIRPFLLRLRLRSQFTLRGKYTFRIIRRFRGRFPFSAPFRPLRKLIDHFAAVAYLENIRVLLTFLRPIDNCFTGFVRVDSPFSLVLSDTFLIFVPVAKLVVENEWDSVSLLRHSGEIANRRTISGHGVHV